MSAPTSPEAVRLDEPVTLRAIMGAGRQGRNVLEICHVESVTTVFLDDTKAPGTIVDNAEVVAGFDAADSAGFVARHMWNVAIGDCAARYRIASQLDDEGARFFQAVDAKAVLSPRARIGRGVYVAAFTRLYSGAVVADWALLEAGTLVGIDVHVGAGTLLGPGAKLLAGSSVGARSLVGAGAVVGSDVHVGSDCVVGANAVVLSDVPNGGRAMGVPARLR